MNEDRIRELLREMRDEPVPADSLARVRLAVAQRTRRAWRWRLLTPALAATAVIALTVWLRTPQSLPQPAPQVVAREQAPPPEPPEPRASVPARPPLRRPERRLVKTAPAAKPERVAEPAEADVVIRIETPDPDVVLLLIGD
jgi:hypothetical protein